MVMSDKNEIETGDHLGDELRCVFVVRRVAGHIAIGVVDTGMEQANQQIGMLFFLDDGNPFLCTLDHILEFHSGPELRRQPVRDFGGDHAENRDLHTIALDHRIGLEIGRSIRLDRIRAYNRRLQLFIHFVIDCVACFDVVVAHPYCIVAEEVDSLRPDMRTAGFLEVIVIHSGLTLKRVAVFEEHNFGTRNGALFLDEAGYLGKRCSSWFGCDEIVRID